MPTDYRLRLQCVVRSDDERAAIVAAAEREGLTVSAWLRRLALEAVGLPTDEAEASRAASALGHQAAKKHRDSQ